MPSKPGKVLIHGYKPPSKKPKQTGRYYRDKRYDTVRWRKMRARHLAANPYCVECKASSPPRFVPAKVLDHIKPVSMGGDFWDTNNHQGMCHHHHNSKSGRERHGKK